MTAYLGQVPRLYNVMFWWSPPSQTLTGSQRYHYDHRDTRQAKVFINLTDVTEDNGPLHFLKPADSLKVDAKVGYSEVFCLICAARYMSVPSTAIAPSISPIAPIASQFIDCLLVGVGEEINPRNRLGECRFWAGTKRKSRCAMHQSALEQRIPPPATAGGDVRFALTGSCCSLVNNANIGKGPGRRWRGGTRARET